MGSGGAYDVFISYAHSDCAAAADLNGWLSDHGVRTFFDRRELRAGLRWVPALEDAIGRSKAVAILVASTGSATPSNMSATSRSSGRLVSRHSR